MTSKGYWVFFKGNEMFWTWMWWNFPGGPVAKTLHSQCLKIPHPQLTPDAAKKTKTKQTNKQKTLVAWMHNSVNILHHWTIHFKWVTCMVCELYLNKTVERKKGLLGGSAVKTLHSQCRAQAQCLISSVQSLSLCNPMDCSLPGFPVHLQLRVYSNSRPLSRWCHPTISSSVIPFSSCLQSFPASGSFPMSQLFTSGSQSIGVSASASVLPMNIQDWFPLGWTGWISLQSKGLSRVISNTTVQNIDSSVFSFLYSPTLTSIHDHWKNHSLD